MTIDIETLIAREVRCCVSSLIHDLLTESPSRLTEQAFELAAPVPDYKEAAIQEDWTGPHKDKFGATYFEDESDGATYACANWQDLCEAQDIEPHDREVYEHWVVTPWLAEKLIEHGEKVDTDFAGLCVWARTTTGQQISADSVIEDIYRELVGG